MTLLKRPWLHFILLGALLYYLQGVFFPAPPPVIGPLNPARIEALEQQWFAATGRMPSAEQRERLVAAELDRDMLFQRALELDLHRYDTVTRQRLLRNMEFLQLGEGLDPDARFDLALEMRLHLGDEVVKRRLVQVMEQLLLAGSPPAPTSEAALREAFAQRGQELRRPPRYSIEHLYFNREREAEVDTVIAAVTEQGLGPEQARQFSSPFLPGYRFTRQTPDQLARHFGAAFVKNLLDQAPTAASWVGPVRSTYGLHYVWVSEVEPARDATFEEVRQQLQRDLETQARERALRDSIAALREHYEIIL